MEAIVMTNGRAYAILVGPTLYLPTGRAVAYEGEVASVWRETGEDPEVCTEMCRSVALVAVGSALVREATALVRTLREERERGWRDGARDAGKARSSGRRSKIAEHSSTTRAGLARRGLPAGMGRTREEFVERCRAAAASAEEIPEAGAEFADSVREKLLGMKETAEDGVEPTARMWEALENMEHGIGKWLDNRWRRD